MTLAQFKEKYGTEGLVLVIRDLAGRANLSAMQQELVKEVLDDVRALMK